MKKRGLFAEDQTFCIWLWRLGLCFWRREGGSTSPLIPECPPPWIPRIFPVVGTLIAKLMLKKSGIDRTGMTSFFHCNVSSANAI